MTKLRPISEIKPASIKARVYRENRVEQFRDYRRRVSGTGEIATEEAVLFYGYKEPLQKLSEGFGYRGVLRYSKDKDKVECHFCGRLFRALNNGHLWKCHTLTAETYKEKTGLSQTTALVGEGTRLKFMKRGHNPNHMQELQKALERRRERKAQGLPDLQSGAKLSLEVKNKRGTCPDQLLDIIDKTIKSYGKVPTEAEFLLFHNGKYLGSIRNTYGTWTNALSKLGKRPNNDRYTRQELLDEVVNFYQVNKRTPRYSDMQRGLLSPAAAYYSRFGSLNNVRLLANVPLVLSYGRRKSEEWMPSSTERETMLAKLN